MTPIRLTTFAFLLLATSQPAQAQISKAQFAAAGPTVPGASGFREVIVTPLATILYSDRIDPTGYTFRVVTTEQTWLAVAVDRDGNRKHDPVTDRDKDAHVVVYAPGWNLDGVPMPGIRDFEQDGGLAVYVVPRAGAMVYTVRVSRSAFPGAGFPPMQFSVVHTASSDVTSRLDAPRGKGMFRSIEEMQKFRPEVESHDQALIRAMVASGNTVVNRVGTGGTAGQFATIIAQTVAAIRNGDGSPPATPPSAPPVSSTDGGSGTSAPGPGAAQQSAPPAPMPRDSGVSTPPKPTTARGVVSATWRCAAGSACVGSGEVDLSGHEEQRLELVDDANTVLAIVRARMRERSAADRSPTLVHYDSVVAVTNVSRGCTFLFEVAFNQKGSSRSFAGGQQEIGPGQSRRYENTELTSRARYSMSPLRANPICR